MVDVGPYYPQLVSINNGSDFTRSLVVDVIFSAANVTLFRIGNSQTELSSKTFQPYVTALSHELADGIDGERTIFVQFDNALGEVYTDSIVVDREPPQVIAEQAIVINEGKTETESRNVSVSLGVMLSSETSVVEFILVNDTSAVTTETFQEVPSNLIVDHQLSEGDGVKQVYVQYRDKAGNTTAFYSAAIGLNTSVLELPVLVSVPNSTSKHLLTVQGESFESARVTLDIE